MTLISVGIILLFLSCLGLWFLGYILNIDQWSQENKLIFNAITGCCAAGLVCFITGQHSSDLLWASILLVCPAIYYLGLQILRSWRHARLYFRHIRHGIPLSGICKVLVCFMRIIIVTWFPAVGKFWKEGNIKVPHPHDYTQDWGIGKRAIWDVFVTICSITTFLFSVGSIAVSLIILFA